MTNAVEPEQLKMFNDKVGPARARIADPFTSHEAARQFERSMNSNSHRAKILEIVKSHAGLTCAEVGNLVKLNRYKVSKRLPELRDAGLIRNGEARICSVDGTNCLTWWWTGI